MDEGRVEVRRSVRRRKTMTVFREAGRLVVVVPARMTAAEERSLVPGLVDRYLRREAGRLLPAGEPDLHRRALSLFERYLAPAVPGFEPRFTIAWSARQDRRWGSCTTATGRIRISERLRTLPDWVGDYVLLHELAHLIVPVHDERFRALVARYPRAERAQGFLEGHSAARGVPEGDDY